MTRRSLIEARRALEAGVLPRVNDYRARQYQQLLGAAEERARAKAIEYITEREAEVRAIRDEALRDLAAVRDGYDDLRSEGGLGRIPADAYTSELNDLRQRQERAEASLRAAEEKVGLIEQVEDDPVRWWDSIIRRMPDLQEDWPW